MILMKTGCACSKSVKLLCDYVALAVLSISNSGTYGQSTDIND